MAQFDPKKLKKDLEELNKLYKELKRESIGAENFKETEEGVKLLQVALSEAKGEVAELNIGFEDTVEFINNIGNEFKKGFNDPLTEGTKSFKTLRSIASQLEDDMKGIVDLEKKELVNIRKKAIIEQQNHKRIKKSLEEKIKIGEKLDKKQQNLLDNLNSEIDINKIIIDQADKRIKAEQKIAKTAGITGALFNSLSNTLGKIGIGGEFFEEGKENIREAAKSGSKLKVVGAGITSVFKGVGQALTDPVTIFGLLTKGFMALLALGQEFAQKTADIGKSFLDMNTSASTVAGSLQTMASNSRYMNYEEAANALKSMNAVAGTSVMISGEQIEAYHKYTHFLGLSEKAAQGLYKVSLLSGKEFGNVGDEIGGVVKGLNQANGTSMSLNDIMEEVTNASAKSMANIGSNPAKLAAAAFQAKKLGLTLDQVAAAGESHLDFENSIAKEMEAELLLGKNLNLETMRAASLSGDEATVAKEMNRLLEENYESTKGNKIQQKALADAMGVSVEELHSMNQARLLQKKMGDMDAKTRIAAEKEVNRLMATGLTHEEALNKLTKKNLENTVKDGETAEATNRALEDAKEKLKGALMPLATKIANAIKNFVESDRFTKMLEAIEKAIKWTVDGIDKLIPKIEKMFDWIKANPTLAALIGGGLVLGKIGASMGKTLGLTPMNPMYVAITKGGILGKAFDGIKNYFTKGKPNINTAKEKTNKNNKTKTNKTKTIKTNTKTKLQQPKLSKFQKFKAAAGKGIKSIGKGISKGASAVGTGISKGASAVGKGYTSLKKGGSKLINKGGALLNKVNPLEKLKKGITGNAGKFIGKAIKGGLIGTLFNLTSLYSILHSKSSPLEKAQQVIPLGASALGGALGAVAGSIIPVVGTIGGGLLGSYIGDYIGTIPAIQKALAPPLAKALGGEDVAADFISRPGQPVQKFRKDDIIVGGTSLGGNGKGNDEIVSLLKELISEVKKGGNIYMDGNKVGKSLALANSRMG